MSSSPSRLEELLPPPRPAPKPFPWRGVLAVFVPAAALAAGTGLQRFVTPLADVPVWLAWSSAAGLLVGGGVALARRGWPWALYGAAAPWLVAGAVWSTMHAVRPAREALADRREKACRAEGRAVCTMQDFTSRCAQATSDPSRAETLLGKPRTSSCNGQSCTSQWVYIGPFRPDQYVGPGALACFVLTDGQGHGIRHWTMATEVP